MSSTTIDPVEEMQTHLKAARAIAATVDAADREYTDDERTQLTELLGKASDAKNRAAKAKGDAAIKAAIVDLGDGIGLNEKSGERRTPAGLIVPGGRKSIGQHYVGSPEYKAMLDSVPGGQFTKQHRVQANPVGFERLVAPKRGEKALVTGASDTSGGAFVRGDDLGLQVGTEPFQRPLTLRDLVTSGTTTSDSIEYVRVTSITNNAAPVAEATTSAAPTQSATTGPLVNAAGGGYKPESGLAVARVTTPVRTIAHWIPVTKRALADAAQMVTLIDGFLEYGLEEELEDQMIAGDGTGENFEGLGNVSGVQAQAYTTDLLTTTRMAKTKVRTTGRSVPNAYVINPADLETIDLIREDGATGAFMFGGPAAAGGATTLWGLPVVESEAVAAGTAYVGDFTKAVLWDRQQSTITTTDSHADFFVRNLVAILAEMRAAFGVLQPSAFVEIDLTLL
ncbi:phage major capsid protein [Pseudonocardia sp. KRD-184]|uniref:Phage major capsid protein n=1 Tax=Pseudonocardia oceani TaxID=2792013 RepID=A0ABS6UJX7_9PSEU|nr:phage major capsid protein [Pseudonocardia oceani]MBW0088239.1 phage major capsid protein [Pseudonocardia oceani]MBW0095021.1 phage major capsid protein [Pseudonocardia oceani]MBW0121126.1 phage major capsid protein [Pseudonocardia oceani]MBW0131188.1 phage major capsid protein [Pseudonocardia oceani]MBW0132550.1 phage major capsid protein [Pseudonocardia oceani]